MVDDVYFDKGSREELLEWLREEFFKKDILVENLDDIDYRMYEESDGCCEMCWSVQVILFASYGSDELKAINYYSYDENDNDWFYSTTYMY